MPVARPLAFLAVLAATVPVAVDAQSRSDLDKAGRIASQPARDVGLSKTKIPPALRRAASAPYSTKGTGRCTDIGRQIDSLDAVLGRDLDRGGPKSETLAAMGGKAVVNSIIPFRGIVREISGAAAADRRKAVAVQAGVARRGFLRGLAAARGCRV